MATGEESLRTEELAQDVRNSACHVFWTQARAPHSQVVCGHLPAYTARSRDDIDVPVQEELGRVPTPAFDGAPATRGLEIPDARVRHADLAPRCVDPAFGVPANNTSSAQRSH